MISDTEWALGMIRMALDQLQSGKSPQIVYSAERKIGVHAHWTLNGASIKIYGLKKEVPNAKKTS